MAVDTPSHVLVEGWKETCRLFRLRLRIDSMASYVSCGVVFMNSSHTSADSGSSSSKKASSSSVVCCYRRVD